MRISRFIACVSLAVGITLASTPVSHATPSSERVLLPVVSVEGIRDDMPIACITTHCEPVQREYLIATAKIPQTPGGVCYENLRGRLTPQTGGRIPVLHVTAVKEVGIACESTERTAQVRVELPSTFNSIPAKVQDGKTGRVLPVPVTVAR